MSKKLENILKKKQVCRIIKNNPKYKLQVDENKQSCSWSYKRKS